MRVGKALNRLFMLLVVAFVLFMGIAPQGVRGYSYSDEPAAGQGPVSAPNIGVLALPTSPVDEKVVPHYFGPYPNWANSPFTLPDAQVAITGDGTGATAVASVGANGVITGITITNPGSGYSAATVSFPGLPASMTIDGTGLTQGVADFAAVVGATADVYNVHVGSATGGSFTLTVDGTATAPILWNAAAAERPGRAGGGDAPTVTGGWLDLTRGSLPSRLHPRWSPWMPPGSPREQLASELPEQAPRTT